MKLIRQSNDVATALFTLELSGLELAQLLKLANAKEAGHDMAREPHRIANKLANVLEANGSYGPIRLLADSVDWSKLPDVVIL